MNQILKDAKFISLDAWNTVLTPNKEYAKARTMFISDTFGLPKDTVESVYGGLKMDLSKMELTLGVIPTIPVIYNIFAERLNLCSSRSNVIRAGMEKLVEIFPPKINPELVRVIMELRLSKVIIVSSNTNFIKGEFLKNVFTANGLKFNRCIFSDEVGRSKPSPAFFEHIKLFAGDVGIKADSIVHVGDNYNCDVLGAFHAGINSLGVNSPDELLNILTEC
jgi:HAD superfamily hydrolase (TIGR01549 family)